MFLFQICVIAVCSLRCCQTMITPETIKHFCKIESEFMELKFLGTTCYTTMIGVPRRRCVSIPNVEVDYGKFGVTPPFPVTNDLSYKILFTGNSLATNYRNVDSIMAFIREPFTCDYALNRTLREVMEDCVKEGRYVEAFIRLMNVIESEGITMLSKLCFGSKKLIEDMQSEAIISYFMNVDYTINQIENKFKAYTISTQPVSQIAEAIKVLRMNDKPLEERKKFFNNTCMEFSQRYGNMMGLVSTGDYVNTARMTSNYRVTIALEHIYKNVNKYFKIETEIWPSGGNELHVLHQLQSE